MKPLEARLRLPLDRFDLDVDLRLDAPSTGIFGPSGSGKTSLLETLAGLRRPAEGTIRFGDELWHDGESGRSLPAERRGVGWAAQDGLLFPHLDVRGNLLAGARRCRRSGLDPEQLLGEAVRLLELGPLLDRSVGALSGGERQRVALGRALCSGPRLLLLDEPFAALDLDHRRALLPFLRRIRERLTVPMLLISHDPVEVQALCDDLVVLRRGRVVARGEPRQVLTDPRVFGLAERAGFENVLRGRVVGGEPERLELAPERQLVTENKVGRGEVLVGLRANDVLLATEIPRGISARNVLPARVREIYESRGLVSVSLDGVEAPILVQVTERTPDDLGLAPDQAVFLVIKATACRVYAMEG